MQKNLDLVLAVERSKNKFTAWVAALHAAQCWVFGFDIVVRYLLVVRMVSETAI